MCGCGNKLFVFVFVFVRMEERYREGLWESQTEVLTEKHRKGKQ